MGRVSRERRKAQVLNRLATSPYRGRKDRNPSAVQGTCEWFISHHLYHEWLGQDASKILWVSADPGCGKSVLVKHLVDSVIQTTASRKVCYFFFKDDFADQKSLLSGLSSILQQLFMLDTALLSDEILLQFDANAQWLTASFVELWQILIKIADSNPATEIICLIDAVDECNEYERSQLFKALCELCGSKKSLNLKFLITSRPYREIGMGFKPLENLNLPVIHLSGESDAEMRKIVKEIDIAIRERVKTIAVQQTLTDDEQLILITQILSVRNRTYLWAHLTLDLIERQLDIRKEKIIDITSHLPKSVNAAYESILCRTFSIEKATRMLHLILAANRPLTLGEMALALELQPHHQSIDDIELEPEDRFRDRIRDICGLVTVNDSRIFLLHQTVKEFLLSMGHSGPVSPSRLSWKHSILASDSNMTLANICVWCLLLNHKMEDQRTTVPPPSTHAKENAFISYAAKNWADHFNRMSVHNQKKMMVVALEICDVKGSCFLSWFPIYWKSRHARFVVGFTTLMAASYFGLEVVVRRALKIDYSQRNKRDETYHRSALSWAAGNGHDGVVKRLIRGLSIGPRTMKIVLRQGANINEFDSDNRTPLTYAIWNRHLSVVRRLVEAGAWVDVPDVLGGTPTAYAVASGNCAIESIVLRGYVPSNEHNKGEELLLSASQYGHIHVVRMLLEAGKTNLNARDDWGWTPLMWAINYRHSGIVKLLLEHKADVDIRGRTGMTPLHLATRYGQFEIAKLILQTGCVDVTIQDLAGSTPLDLATSFERGDIAELIWQSGMNNNAKNPEYKRFGMSWIVKCNHSSTLEYMLELHSEQFNMRECTIAILQTDGDWEDKTKLLLSFNMIDMSLPDTNGDTVLHQAVQRGANEVLERLILTGKAPLNSRNILGLTPLALSCSIDNLTMLEILLQNHQVDVNIVSRNGDSPLHLAIHKNSVPATALLLSTGRINIEIKNKDGFTPLSLACLMGNLRIARRLFYSYHANINSQDMQGRTPLHNCAWNEELEVVRFILKTTEADLKIVDNLQQTALLFTCYLRKWNMARILAESGNVGINKKGPRSRTALSLATMHANVEIVKLLASLEQSNVNLMDDEGLTPLSYAAQQGNEEITLILLATPGIDVDAQDNTGMTALGHAARKGHLGVVELLLDKGKAKCWISDSTGKTPLALASAGGHLQVAHMIECHYRC
ncbi:hypothetical protein LB504_009200 [Fusarium proliferatum]|nr:hypothetical protein LB504_009200 [Fusarium proliferatum]